MLASQACSPALRYMTGWKAKPSFLGLEHHQSGKLVPTGLKYLGQTAMVRPRASLRMNRGKFRSTTLAGLTPTKSSVSCTFGTPTTSLTATTPCWRFFRFLRRAARREGGKKKVWANDRPQDRVKHPDCHS